MSPATLKTFLDLIEAAGDDVYGKMHGMGLLSNGYFSEGFPQIWRGISLIQQSVTASAAIARHPERRKNSPQQKCFLTDCNGYFSKGMQLSLFQPQEYPEVFSLGPRH
jgi:hypothetical protein